ncbi:MAG: hypothetical protein ABFR62_09520 [Bacteroidota bacterium]
MKNLIKTMSIILFTTLLFSSCDKDDEGNIDKIIDNEYYSEYTPGKFITTEDWDTSSPDGVMNYLGSFEYDNENLLKSIEMIVNEDGTLIGILSMETTVENSKITELMVSFLDGEKHIYKYTYEEDKIKKVEKYKNSNYLNKKSASDLDFSSRNIFASPENNGFISEDFSLIWYYTLMYKGDKVEKLEYYIPESDEIVGTVKVFWDDNNISRIENTNHMHPDKDLATIVYEFEYDTKPNLQKYMALCEYATNYVSELGIEANHMGLISYFSDNNLKHVKIDYPASEVFNIEVSTVYDGEIATAISMQYANGGCVMSSTVDYIQVEK